MVLYVNTHAHTRTDAQTHRCRYTCAQTYKHMDTLTCEHTDTWKHGRTDMRNPGQTGHGHTNT